MVRPPATVSSEQLCYWHALYQFPGILCSSHGAAMKLRAHTDRAGETGDMGKGGRSFRAYLLVPGAAVDEPVDEGDHKPAAKDVTRGHRDQVA